MHRPLRHEDISHDFAQDIIGHRMRVIMDQGLHRHLIFAREGDDAHWFEIVTWPGSITVRSDKGSYVFAGREDMFELFCGRGINPHYWSQKLQSHAEVASYSAAAFRRQVLAWADSILDEELDDIESSMTGRSPGYELHQALDHELFPHTDGCDDESHARELLENFSCLGMCCTDAWEMEFHEWDYTFLWCCHALKHAVSCYVAHQDAVGAC